MDVSKRCVVIAIFKPLEGSLQEVKDILTSIIPEVHEEPGCEFYALHEDTEGRLIFVEAWDTRELWQEHSAFHTVTRIQELTKPHLAGEVEVIEMYGVPAGTDKGVIPPHRG